MIKETGIEPSRRPRLRFEVEGEVDEAVVAKDHAIERLRDARGATGLWLTVFPQQLQELPGGPEALTRFLAQAASDYERFARQQSDDADLELERGRNWLRLGNVRRQLADDRAALDAYEQAERIFSKLAAQPDRAFEGQMERATAEIGQGLALSRLGNRLESERLFDSAITPLGQLVAQSPEDPRPRQVLADAYFNKAVVQFESGQAGAAAETAAQAASHYEVLWNDRRQGLSYRVALANATSLQGELA